MTNIKRKDRDGHSSMKPTKSIRSRTGCMTLYLKRIKPRSSGNSGTSGTRLILTGVSLKTGRGICFPIRSTLKIYSGKSVQ